MKEQLIYILILVILISITIISILSSRNKLKKLLFSLSFKHKKLLKLLLLTLSIAILCVFIIIKIFLKDYYIVIIQEDNLVENCQIIFLFFSFLLSVITSINFLRRKKIFLGILLLIIGFLFLIWAFEEISWFQRIFNIESPEYFIVQNFQEEISIHNLMPIQKILHILYIIISFMAIFSWVIIPNRLKSNTNSPLNYFVPNWYLMVFFLPVFALYLYFEFNDFIVLQTGLKYLKVDYGNYLIIWRDQEPAELMMMIDFLLIIIIVLYKQNKILRYNEQ